jgi:methylase of polypeptide subunit release factors
LASNASQERALEALLQHLRTIDYHFVTGTPATHARVIARRRPRLATSAQGILGWSLPFLEGSIEPTLVQLLRDADVLLTESDGLLRARVRVSTLHGQLFLHSAYPTTAEDAVFLGPDSYRFADLIRSELLTAPLKSGSVVVDIGTGAGVGAVVAADLSPGARMIMTDLNVQALALAQINARHAGHTVEARRGRDLAGFADPIDLAFANPPYIIDPDGRAYRDGGGHLGAEISIAMTRAALLGLRPEGRFILYTGSAIVSGHDALEAELQNLAQEHGRVLRYRELDPDVFGEELDSPGYETVDRIAVVAAIFDRKTQV